MEPMTSRADQAFLEELRLRRGELKESMDAVEAAMAAPATADASRWAQRLHVALVELAGDFRAHIAITEGPDGLYQDLLRVAPRLSGAVEALTGEHVAIGRELDGLLARVADPETVPEVPLAREEGTALLGRMVRHRQRGSDLLYEAYEFDIGGET